MAIRANLKPYIEGYNSDNSNGWSYDLSLGEEVYITSEKEPKILTPQEPYVSIRPGDFALLITDESISVPAECMAFISVKFTYKQKGLINISGFHVDPKYKGKIIFSVYNAGPNDILLKLQEPVFMIFYEELGFSCDEKRKSYDHIPVTMISEIRGQSSSLAENRQKIEELEHEMKLYGSIAIAIIITLLGIILTKVLR
ncbi:MAG TPA: hypothetical protein DDW50_08675 [Firmicutes bacterium]|jgi:dCTP deaminase|nr:hypothetical protein [Bacillota bacterium]